MQLTRDGQPRTHGATQKPLHMDEPSRAEGSKTKQETPTQGEFTKKLPGHLTEASAAEPGEHA